MRIYISNDNIHECLKEAQEAGGPLYVRQLSVRVLDNGDVFHVHFNSSSGRSSTPKGSICIPASDRVPLDEEQLRLIIAEQLGSATSPALVILCQRSSNDGSLSLSGFLADPTKGETSLGEVCVIPDREGLFSRTAGILSTDRLLGKKVCIVGLGSGGSICAIELAKCGVGEFYLIDFDRLELHNVARHSCGLSDLGRYKTWAVRDLILDKNPHCVVHTAEDDILHSSTRLEDAVAESDLVIAGTDNNRTRRAINKLCLRHERTCLYGRLMLRACGGDVLRVLPGLGPCYECVLEAIWRRKPEEISNDVQAKNISDYGVVAEPGLSNDIQPVANMIVKLALQEMVRGTGSRLESLDEDLTCNFYMWANRREEQYAHWPPMSNHIDDLSILRWYGVRVERRPDCPACCGLEQQRRPEHEMAPCPTDDSGQDFFK